VASRLTPGDDETCVVPELPGPVPHSRTSWPYPDQTAEEKRELCGVVIVAPHTFA
jgi:hypothetical protein